MGMRNVCVCRAPEQPFGTFVEVGSWMGLWGPCPVTTALLDRSYAVAAALQPPQPLHHCTVLY